MGKHYIIRLDGVVQLYHFKYEKEFQKNYVKAVPHRPRKAERKFKKRVRVYTRKITVVYFSIYVVNAKGSGCSKKRGTWSFTVDASVYTSSLIDEERINGLGNLAESLAAWLVDEFGLYNAVFTTVGSQFDAEHPAEDAKRQGLFVVNVDVEDVTMAQGNYRSGRNIDRVNDCMFTKSAKRESYSVRNCQVFPRLASHIRVCK